MSSASVVFIILFYLTKIIDLSAGYLFMTRSLLSRFYSRYDFKIKMTSSTSDKTLMECISEHCSLALSQSVKLEPTQGGGASGGGGATTLAWKDVQSGTKYFVKTASLSSGGGTMLYGEYRGVQEMDQTLTIRVPRPITYGEYSNTNKTIKGGLAFVVFEYLEFTYGGDEFELGKQLAMMHRCMSPTGKFGFHVENTIGATPQYNEWMDDWSEFWDTHRLGYMLRLTNDADLDANTISKLRVKTKELLSNHSPSPSLIHGDLWGGNKGYARVNDNVVPVIFDPATYYGDREADVAMTYLFGGFGSKFYEGYNTEWPLSEGHENRRIIYNLYHILNHEVLFGGYSGQAQSMIQRILRMN